MKHLHAATVVASVVAFCLTVEKIPAAEAKDATVLISCGERTCHVEIASGVPGALVSRALILNAAAAYLSKTSTLPAFKNQDDAEQETERVSRDSSPAKRASVWSAFLPSCQALATYGIGKAEGNLPAQVVSAIAVIGCAGASARQSRLKSDTVDASKLTKKLFPDSGAQLDAVTGSWSGILVLEQRTALVSIGPFSVRTER